MDTTHRRKHASRVLPGTISVLQEDALIGLMYEDFGRNRFKSLDYNKVRRFALSIQTDPAICSALDSEPVEPAEAWEPPDSWITDMCMAFINANEEEKKAKERTQKSAFGGGREEYDPKNPHKRSGAKQQQQQQQQQQRVGQ